MKDIINKIEKERKKRKKKFEDISEHPVHEGFVEQGPVKEA